MSSFRTFSTSIFGHLNPSSLHWTGIWTWQWSTGLPPRSQGSPSLDFLPQVPVLLVHAEEEGPGLEVLVRLVLFRLVLSMMVLVPFWADLLLPPFLDDFLHLFGSLLILLLLVAAGVGFVAGAASAYLMAGCRRVLIVRWVLDHFLLSSACEGWSRRKLVLRPWPLFLCCSRCIVPHVT